MHDHDEILAALVGQPNSGKSTVFNYLTGLHQSVANFPGVTVAKKSGHYHEGKRRIEVVDLPGTYSLTSYSQEERVTRDFLLLERPEVVVMVVDASNLRRHLYLAFQLRELQVPLVVCLNMMDIAQRRGVQIDVAKLEAVLGVPVVPTVARSSQKRPTCKCHKCSCASQQAGEVHATGLEALRHQINDVSKKHAHETQPDWKVDYGDLEPLIAELDALLAQKTPIAQDFPTRWLALKLLENDREARRIIQHHTHEPGWEELLHTCLQKIEQYVHTDGDSLKKTIASKRNDYAEQIERAVIYRVSQPRRRSDRVDRVLCHPIGGLFCIAAVLYLMFSLAFNIADGWEWFPWVSSENTFEWQTPTGALDSIFSVWIPQWLDLLALPDGGWRSLLYDGIVAGVGGVVTFIPIICLIFFFVSIVEQSGGMARGAVVLDRLMRLFGLHGLSIIPMILAGGIVGGCAVPAVMATRTMRSERERLLTIMVLPLMNCGGKVPVYALLISAFFSAYRGWMMLAVILMSWSCAFGVAFLLSKFFVKGSSSPLLLELPAYQVPLLRDVLRTAGLQSWWFIKRAGTIILLVNVILWALMYYPRPEGEGGLETSYMSRIGRLFEPVSQYAGFDWRDNVALIGGAAAKEVVVSSMITMYEIEGDGEEAQNERLALRLRSAEGWSPFKAFAMLLFVMIYCPCAATCMVIWRETGHIKYMLAAILYTNILAFFLAVVVYQIGNFLI
ncbi:MAG: ferrous iron transport protein B [Planctomycetaceae bacterium]|jgi:ferrous iron transport protein B|nr:ferrous iron transport protein B [Planctomycetaceae bacterium]